MFLILEKKHFLKVFLKTKTRKISVSMPEKQTLLRTYFAVNEYNFIDTQETKILYAALCFIERFASYHLAVIINFQLWLCVLWHPFSLW